MTVPALGSALLLVLSYPPFGLVVAPFVALAPFAVGVARLPPDGGASRAFRDGALLGGVSWAVLLHWMAFGLRPWTPWAVVGWVAVVAALALATGAVGWALHRGHHGAGAPMWVAVPLTWTAGEWGLAHLPGSLAFPWLGLGTALAGTPELAGVAELVGARGVTAWLALVSGLVADAVVRRRRRFLPILAAAVVTASVGGWGVWRAETLPVDDVLDVMLVQPAVPEPVKREARRAETETMAALERLVDRAEAEHGAGRVDLVVLPEAVFPTPLDGPGGAPLVARLSGWAGRLGAPVLVGGIGMDDRAVHNSAFLVDAAGLAGPRWDKRYLVPVVERVPLLPGLRRLEDAGGARGLWSTSYAPGQGWPLFVVEAHSVDGSADGAVGGPRGRGSDATRPRAVGAFVCYEAAFPSVARGLRRAGAEVLVNVTNDAWFGGGPGRAPSTAYRQHPAHVVLRAIETRTGTVRVANTGLSFVVDPTGRVLGRLPAAVEAVGVATVRTAPYATAFVRFGDVAGPTAFLGTLVLLVAAGWLGRRRPPARHPGRPPG